MVISFIKVYGSEKGDTVWPEMGFFDLKICPQLE